MKNKIRKFTHYAVITYAFSLAPLATFGVGYCLYAVIFLGARVNFLIG